MKKLHLLVIKSFIGPFFATFFVAIFVLLMQFLWKYVDELVGKGLDGFIIGELLFYQSASIIPMALPLALLLSSIMTFGNLGEHYEMVAIKAAGVPIRRIFAPMFILMVFISIGAFLVSNILIPKANLKSGALLYDVRHQKPSLLIKEGVFNNDIEGYSIRIGKKDADNESIHDVIIYDQTQDANSGRSVLVAESGKMVMSEDKRYLFLTLYKGKRYEDMPAREGNKPRTYPHNIVRFGEEHIIFDLTEFKISRTNEDLFKGSFAMLNVVELQQAADSVGKATVENQKVIPQFASTYFRTLDSEFVAAAPMGALPDKNIIRNYRQVDHLNIYNNALNTARTVKSITDYGVQVYENMERSRIRYLVEWHRKYTLSMACLLLFFIGAPLGTIIRKGGFGMPVVFSVLIFVLYHILSMVGEKIARQMLVSPFWGMWLSTLILAPLGLFLTYKASIDSNLFNSEEYSRFFMRIRNFFIRKKAGEGAA